MALEWWQNTVIYQIYLASFKDGNQDGKGDFPGLMSKLNYFDNLKVGTLLLSPFYPSPMKDNGYDITDNTGVDPICGTIEDFDNLMREIKKRDLNILLDFVANHTSDQHSWFLKSIQGEEPYKDYYIWAEPKFESGDIQPPNNWISVFGGSAWTWNKERQQFYLHQFLPEQPDLNYNNPIVRHEMKEILKFWLDKGVDGFRIDAASHLFEDEMLRDEPVVENTESKPGEYNYLNHIYTKGQSKNLELIGEWRQVLTEYQKKTGKYKVLITETYEEINETMRYYGTATDPLADIPQNFELLELKSDSTPRELLKAIEKWTDAMPEGKHPNWILGSHDHSRLASRVGCDMVSSLQMMVLMSPGVAFCYYGDELGMENVSLDPEDMKDSYALRTVPENSRDPSRTPMQWNDEQFSGFTEAIKPWLPIHENFHKVNVKIQQQNQTSVLEIYKKLLELRNSPSIRFGIVEYPLIDDRVFSMARVLEGSKSFLIVFNMTCDSCIVDFTGKSAFLPHIAYLEVTNNNLYFCLESEINSNVSIKAEVSNKTNDEHTYSELLIENEQKCGNSCKLRNSSDGSLQTKTNIALYESFLISNKLNSLIEYVTEHVMSTENTDQWKLFLNCIFLRPKEAMVLSFIPNMASDL